MILGVYSQKPFAYYSPAIRFSGQLTDQERIQRAKALLVEHALFHLKGINLDYIQRISPDCWYEFSNSEVSRKKHPTDLMRQLAKQMENKPEGAMGCIWLHNTQGTYPIVSQNWALYGIDGKIPQNSLPSAVMVVDAKQVLYPDFQMPQGFNYRLIKIQHPTNGFIFMQKTTNPSHSSVITLNGKL